MSDYPGTIGTYHFDKNGDVTGGPFFTEYVITNGEKILLNQ